MIDIDTTFLSNVSSKEPVPGGGGASAFGGALAASLAMMVGNLTVGKKAYADVEDETFDALMSLDSLRNKLIALIGEDARVFTPLIEAYRMPKDTPEEKEAKNAALQSALVDACDVPLEIMETAFAIIPLCDFLCRCGSTSARSDVGVAVAFARAAIDGAALNIDINTAAMDDQEQAMRYVSKAQKLRDEANIRCTELYNTVRKSITE